MNSQGEGICRVVCRRERGRRTRRRKVLTGLEQQPILEKEGTQQRGRGERQRSVHGVQLARIGLSQLHRLRVIQAVQPAKDHVEMCKGRNLMNQAVRANRCLDLSETPSQLASTSPQMLPSMILVSFPLRIPLQLYIPVQSPNTWLQTTLIPWYKIHKFCIDIPHMSHVCKFLIEILDSSTRLYLKLSVIPSGGLDEYPSG